jgi:5'(3')-deoxyribonucleotidase
VSKYNLKKLLHIDLDGVIADFISAMHSHPLREIPPYDEHPDTIPHIFRNLQPIESDVTALQKLLNSNKYEIYFLSTAPWNNPSAWTDKRLWLEEQFGDVVNRKLILTHRKDLIKGDILIDDRPNNGADKFQGEWIQFGSDKFPNWNEILNYLL